MTNPFRTDLIDIFVKRGHKGKEIVEEVREIEALLDGQRCEWTLTEEGLWKTQCGQEIPDEDTYEKYPFCPCCGKRISIKEVKDEG